MEPRSDDSLAQLRGAVTSSPCCRSDVEGEFQSLGRCRAEPTHEHLVRPAEHRLVAARAGAIRRDRLRRLTQSSRHGAADLHAEPQRGKEEQLPGEMKVPKPEQEPPLEQVLGSAGVIDTSRIEGEGPGGRLPLTPALLPNEPSGTIFGLTQNAGMGWRSDALGGPQYVIVSTMGGLRSEQGEPIALGYHTGHWEIGLLVRGAAEALRAAGAVPFAVYCSDPCDGRTQGTTGMFDSLAYRNDAAMVMRRLIRSLPTASGVMGIATCDKGLPATMLALAGTSRLPGVVVPGGVTLPPIGGEDAGQVQSLNARFSRDLITLDYAQEMGCRACGSSGGGCQFLGTAATSQVVAEGLGLALPHSALTPSGEPAWTELGRRSATALVRLHALGIPISKILTQHALENAMLVHAAFGGSTNLLLHIPAIARAAGLRAPTVQDWIRINRSTPRLVDALPNGPRGHPTVQVFMAGGVPEVMLHLRKLGLLHEDVLTATGDTLATTLDWWTSSERRRNARARLASAAK